MLTGILDGFGVVLSLPGLAVLAAGTIVGIIVGVLPGLGGSLAVALLVPFTYDMPASLSLVLLVAVYMASEYGGSISAILISTPGTAAAAATLMDGYPMNRNGRAGLALSVSLNASTVGGVVGGVVLIALALPLADVALRFGPSAYFSVGVFGLTMVASLSGQSMVKGLIAGALGFAVMFVGVDPITGVQRFTFGHIELLEGIPFVPAMIGLFALSEVLHMVERGDAQARAQRGLAHVFLTLRQWRELVLTMLRGSVIGTLVGILPGVGGSVAGWLAYDTEKRLSKTPEAFGTGVAAGVAAPESANNATVGGALIPMLTLGVPGSPTTAILMGALVLHGLQPGPHLFNDSPEIVYSLYAGLLASVAAMYVFGSLALPIWVRLISVPNSVLAAVVFGLGAVGAYAIRNTLFDVWLALGFGIVGHVLKKYGFPLAPMILAIVLGPLIETNLRRALLMSKGSYWIFVEDPVSLIFVLLSIASLAWPVLRDLWRGRSRRGASGLE